MCKGIDELPSAAVTADSDDDNHDGYVEGSSARQQPLSSDSVVYKN